MDLVFASGTYYLQTRPTLPPRTDGIRFHPVPKMPKPVASWPVALHECWEPLHARAVNDMLPRFESWEVDGELRRRYGIGKRDFDV